MSKNITIFLFCAAFIDSICHWIQFGKWDLFAECIIGILIVLFLEEETRKKSLILKKNKIIKVVEILKLHSDWKHHNNFEYESVEIFKDEQEIFIYIYFFKNGKMDICVQKNRDKNLEIFENKCSETIDFIIQTIEKYFKK